MKCQLSLMNTNCVIFFFFHLNTEYASVNITFEASLLFFFVVIWRKILNGFQYFSVKSKQLKSTVFMFLFLFFLTNCFLFYNVSLLLSFIFSFNIDDVFWKNKPFFYKLLYIIFLFLTHLSISWNKFFSRYTVEFLFV